LLAFAIGAGDGRIIGLDIESNARAVVAQGDFAGLVRNGAAGFQFLFKVAHSWLVA
jgi:hypothetical protein